jgi:GNAT superfamily N-acetyltransferase
VCCRRERHDRRPFWSASGERSDDRGIAAPLNLDAAAARRGLVGAVRREVEDGRRALITAADCDNDGEFLHAPDRQLARPADRIDQLLARREADKPVGVEAPPVAHDEAPERLAKGVPRHPVPVIILARLAVDRTWRGKGLGAALVVDAMRRVLQAADIAGVRAMVVHAKDETAQRFYEHLGFEQFPEKALTLYRLLKDIRAMSEVMPVRTP